MNVIRTCIVTLAVAAVASSAAAKLPPLSDEAKAKAAEAAARTAWSNKVADYKLCLSMERVAAKFRADQQAAGKPVRPATPTPACTDPGPFVPPAPQS